MTDDAAVLQAIWMSDADGSDGARRDTVVRVLEKDAAANQRERRMRIGGAIALLLLLPAVLWAAAYGVSPLVRSAYGLMAVGVVAGLSAEWLYLDWSRRALPGPDDTRAQLQKTALMLEYQMRLGRTGIVWTSPVFAGVLLICVWLYRERSGAEAVALGLADVAAWVGAGAFVARAVKTLGERRQRLEDVLSGL